MAVRLGVFWLLTALVTLACQAETTLPGVKIRVTKKAIDYVNRVAHDKLAAELRGLRIPDQSGKEGRKYWSFTSVRTRSVTVPATSMTLTPSQRGLTWGMSNLGLKLNANWRVKYRRGWFKFSTSGSVDVDFLRVSLHVTIATGSDRNGRPTVSMASCSASVGDVKVKFHKGISFILNLFKKKIGRKVKDMVRGKMCNIIQKVINVDGTRALSKLKVDVKIAKKFLLDYGLTRAPTVRTSYLETEHKGAVTWIGDKTRPPFSPKPFPPTSQSSKMMYLWLSEYLANSWAFAAQRHNFLSIDLVAANFPSSYLQFIEGRLSPQMKKDHPKAKLQAKVMSTSAPHLTLTREGMALATNSSVSLYANIPGQPLKHLLTLNLNLSISLQVSIQHTRLVGRVTGHAFDVTVARSNVDNMVPDLLTYILEGAIKFFAVPQLNKLAAKGVDLPVSTGDVKFVNPSISHLDGAILISTDVQYL